MNRSHILKLSAVIVVVLSDLQPGAEIDRVVLTNGARINVPAFNGVDRVNTGNLELIAQTISIDATSSIVADGAGYQPGPAGGRHGAVPGGPGGCSSSIYIA